MTTNRSWRKPDLTTQFVNSGLSLKYKSTSGGRLDRSALFFGTRTRRVGRAVLGRNTLSPTARLLQYLVRYGRCPEPNGCASRAATASDVPVTKLSHFSGCLKRSLPTGVAAKLKNLPAKTDVRERV